MSKSAELSRTREGTIINTLSKEQEYTCTQVVENVIAELQHNYQVDIVWKKTLMLKDVVNKLRQNNPDVNYNTTTDTSYIKPDGGLVYIKDNTGTLYPILIPEVKTQGTNKKRMAEGKKEQSKGNAIERLGKNVIVVKEYLRNENINPFVCFGQGCDFCDGSTILDRVVSIAGFHPINCVDMYGDTYGSFFFREEKWSIDEMQSIFLEIATMSIEYYLQKYADNF